MHLSFLVFVCMHLSIINVFMNGLINQSRPKAHGPRLMVHGSRLMTHDRSEFSWSWALSQEPWALSHEAWAICHEPLSINSRLVHKRLIIIINRVVFFKHRPFYFRVCIQPLYVSDQCFLEVAHKNKTSKINKWKRLGERLRPTSRIRFWHV